MERDFFFPYLIAFPLFKKRGVFFLSNCHLKVVVPFNTGSECKTLVPNENYSKFLLPPNRLHYQESRAELNAVRDD